MPLPSSDRRKDTVHFGDSSFTVWCMILEKLRRRKKTGERVSCGWAANPVPLGGGVPCLAFRRPRP